MWLSMFSLLLSASYSPSVSLFPLSSWTNDDSVHLPAHSKTTAPAPLPTPLRSPNCFSKSYSTRRVLMIRACGQRMGVSLLCGVLVMRKISPFNILHRPLFPPSPVPHPASRITIDIYHIGPASATTATTSSAGKTTRCKKQWTQTATSTARRSRRRASRRGISVRRHRR